MLTGVPLSSIFLGVSLERKTQTCDVEQLCSVLDVARPDKISGADINSICQEAGMMAVRENRYIVLAKDFEKAYKNQMKKDEQEHEFYK